MGAAGGNISGELGQDRAGGIGMTTLAYAAVTQSGLSFERQLWMRPEIIPGFAALYSKPQTPSNPFIICVHKIL